MIDNGQTSNQNLPTSSPSKSEGTANISKDLTTLPTSESSSEGLIDIVSPSPSEAPEGSEPSEQSTSEPAHQQGGK